MPFNTNKTGLKLRGEGNQSELWIQALHFFRKPQLGLWHFLGAWNQTWLKEYCCRGTLKCPPVIVEQWISQISDGCELFTTSSILSRGWNALLTSQLFKENHFVVSGAQEMNAASAFWEMDCFCFCLLPRASLFQTLFLTSNFFLLNVEAGDASLRLQGLNCI